MYDVVTFGRSSIDLYSNDIGAPFHKIRSFNAYVGGSSTNIAVGCARLGLSAALISAVGQDKVGEFILHFLRQEKVDTSFVFVKPDGRSSAVLLGIEPPDRFPLVYYRENAADILVTKSDLLNFPSRDVKYLILSGTALSREPSRTAVFTLVEKCDPLPVKIILDLDYRHDQWPDLLTYQGVIKDLLSYIDIVLGTREEVIASGDETASVSIRDQQISAPLIEGDLIHAIESITLNRQRKLIVKAGEEGAYLYDESNNGTHIPGYKVDILNVLGAGDAFAAGLTYGFCKGWSMVKSIRLANGCGAFVVTQPGCANFNPTLDQVMDFIELRGGL